jgi:hypothetical protein
MARRTEGTDDDSTPVKARVLVKTHIDGVPYEPNAVVSAPASVIKGLEAQGAVDSSEGAVSYAESLAT